MLGRLLLTLAIASLAGCMHPSAHAPDAPTVSAAAGTFVGQREGALEVYRGIAYAEPPVGPLRWRPPVPKRPAEAAVDATTFGAACVQLRSSVAANSIYAEDVGEMSEDCLSLNIWTPADARDAPVFVWIHGGALVSGASKFGMYDGARMAKAGLVFVSINYRLGPLGYLAHPELSAESPRGISGNYGLLDQIEALRWIARNIAAFGGDPGNVTIAGESAGALSVMYLLASPDARGLFDRAISQSGYMISSPALNRGEHGHPAAEQLGVALQQQLGARDLAALRAMDAEALVTRALGGGYLTWGTIDGELLPDQLVDVFDRGDQAPVPLLVGFNSGEIRSLRRLLPPAPADAASYEAQIRAAYGDLAERFLRLYPASDIDESMLATTRDALYGWTAERMARRQTAIGQDAWLYLFDHGYPAADAAGLHAFHASEIPYVLGNTDRTTAAWPRIPDTAAERAFGEAMLAYWVSFAKGDKPAAPESPDWAAFGADGNLMVFTDRPAARRGGIGDGFALMEALVCRRRAQGDTPWHWNVGIASPPVPQERRQCR